MPGQNGPAKALAEDVELRSRVNSRVNRTLVICVFVFLAVLMLSLGITCIVYGAQCLNAPGCEPYRLIPIYLVAFGAIVLASLPNNCGWVMNPEKQSRRGFVLFAVYRLTTWVAEIATLIFGSVVVYGVPLEELKKNNPKCPCLMVGFVLVTASWVAICLSIVLSCTVTCCYACAITKEMKKNPKGQSPRDESD